MFAPAGLPQTLQDKIAADLRQTLQSPPVTARFRELGLEPTGLSGEPFNALVKSDYARWGELIRKKNITVH
ncbi:MAG: hypothetical protein EXR39_11075 [Betaproteobacteria bacterium]|nr:hypothetical protein [Betaproteobacteria bacterium]